MRLSRRSEKGDIMFEIEIRDGLLHIGGYVNAVGRDSKPIFSKKRGRCVEQVTPGAFSSSLADGHEVFMKLNHEKVIATTADGSLELREDNIGLKAQATVSDEEVITMAEKGLLKAWSFGFEAIDDDMEERSGQLPRRHLNRIKLNEVSVLSKSPAYEGTLVELRDGDACEPEDTDGTADEPAKEEPDETAAKLAEIRTFIALEEIGELIRQGEAEYRAYRDREEAQAFIDAAEAQQWIDEQEEEERYNHYHNPQNGQFASGAGGATGLYYSYGKGKGGVYGGEKTYNSDQHNGGFFESDESNKKFRESVSAFLKDAQDGDIYTVQGGITGGKSYYRVAGSGRGMMLESIDEKGMRTNQHSRKLSRDSVSSMMRNTTVTLTSRQTPQQKERARVQQDKDFYKWLKQQTGQQSFF